jgi:hypothetical protein
VDAGADRHFGTALGALAVLYRPGFRYKKASFIPMLAFLF